MALDRKVWVESAQSIVYPNLYVLLVAPPGVGKSEAIKVAREILRTTRGPGYDIKLAPDDMTKASMLDALSNASQTHIYSVEGLLKTHALGVVVDELGVLIKAHDLEFLSALNALYDARDFFRETRRGRSDTPIELENPLLNVLAGTQPDYMGSIFPPEAWGMGTLTRILMIYHGKPTRVSLFGERKQIDRCGLTHDLAAIHQLHGKFVWTKEAEDDLVTWYEAGLLPIPSHTKLKHYLPRRILHMFKLIMVSCASRGNDMVIEPVDVSRARDWLIEAEALMPEIFKDMSGSPDHQIILELHQYAWELWVKGGKKPLHRARLEMFLSQRTPAYNIENIFKTCVRAKILVESGAEGSNLYIPGTENQTGEVG